MVSAIRLPASDLRSEIRCVVAEIGAHATQLDRLSDELAIAACRARLAAAFEQLEDLQAELPAIPTTFADLTILAEIAHAWADKDGDGSIVALDRSRSSPDCHFAARVVRAVLALAGTERRVP